MTFVCPQHRIPMSNMEPALKKGWLRKQSRSGIVKNWQSRFFVMTKGKIAYYSKELDRFPYGDDLKVSDCIV